MAEHTLDGIETVVKLHGYTAIIGIKVRLPWDPDAAVTWVPTIRQLSSPDEFSQNTLRLRHYAEFALAVAAVADGMDTLSGGHIQQMNGGER